MNDLLIDIINFLVKHDIVEGDGIDAFRDYMPNEPDNVVVINEYAGSPTMPFEPSVHRSLQIVVRDKRAGTAKKKCYEIFRLFDVPTRYLELNDTRWCQVYPRQTPFKMKVDENNRIYYVFNMGITTIKE